MADISNDPTAIPEDILPRLDPEYRDFVLSRPPSSRIPAHKIGWSLELREAINSSTAGKADPIPVGSVDTLDLGNFSILILTPDGSAPEDGWPVLIYAHSGGLLFGTARSEQSFTTRVCIESRCVVVSVDYRLAPEHKFPSSTDDVWETLLWIRDEGAAKLNLNRNRVAVGGYSSGGTLVAAIAQRAALSQPPIPLLGQLILMAPLDHTRTFDEETWSQSMREYAKVPGLWSRDVVWSTSLHTPNPTDRAHSDISPLLQTQERAFNTLAPAWIGVAELDPLRNDGENYAQKLTNEGVSVELKTYQGAAHLTPQADGVCELARRIRGDQIQFLKTLFAH